MILCTIWYHLHNSRNVKNVHGGVLLSVKLQAEAWTNDSEFCGLNKPTMKVKSSYCRGSLACKNVYKNTYKNAYHAWFGPMF